MKIHWRGKRLSTPVFLGFPGGSAGKESACNVGDLGLGGEEEGKSFWYFDLLKKKKKIN